MIIMITDFRNYKRIVHILDTRPSGSTLMWGWEGGGSRNVWGIGDPGEEVEED